MLSLEHQELSNKHNKGYLPEDLWGMELDKWLSGKDVYGRQKEPPTFFTTLDALNGVGFTNSEKLGRGEEMRGSFVAHKGFLKDEQQRTINGVRSYFWYQAG